MLHCVVNHNNWAFYDESISYVFGMHPHDFVMTCFFILQFISQRFLKHESPTTTTTLKLKTLICKVVQTISFKPMCLSSQQTRFVLMSRLTTMI